MEKIFFDQPVKSHMRTYNNIWKIATGQGRMQFNLPWYFLGKFFFINSLPICLLGNFNFVALEDTLRVVTFSDKQKQNIEESSKFSWRGVLKRTWKIYKAIKDWGQGRGNMEKSSFAFKRNAIKRSEFHVCFLLVDLFNIWFHTQLWMRIVSHIPDTFSF